VDVHGETPITGVVSYEHEEETYSTSLLAFGTHATLIEAPETKKL